VFFLGKFFSLFNILLKVVILILVFLNKIMAINSHICFLFPWILPLKHPYSSIIGFKCTLLKSAHIVVKVFITNSKTHHFHHLPFPLCWTHHQQHIINLLFTWLCCTICNFNVASCSLIWHFFFTLMNYLSLMFVAHNITIQSKTFCVNHDLKRANLFIYSKMAIKIVIENIG
jgi:hypothetical protein